MTAAARRPAFACPHCGTPLARTPRRGPGIPRGALQIRCPHCRYRMFDYPRLCVGFTVVRRGHLLMLVRGHEPRRGAIDLPGGFLETGEDPEAAARRELHEETGLRVGPATPLGTWWDTYDLPGFGPFPTFNWYFHAAWRSGTPRAGDDAAEAHWIPFADLGKRLLQRRFAWAHMRAVVRAVHDRAHAGRARRVYAPRS